MPVARMGSVKRRMGIKRGPEVKLISFFAFSVLTDEADISSSHRVTRIIRTSFLATNIRHQFVKRLDSINIQSAAFACCWQIFVSQKISDLKALIFRWFLVRRTTQGINLARTTSRKAPKIKTLRLVRVILVTLSIVWYANYSTRKERSQWLCANKNPKKFKEKSRRYGKIRKYVI